jgi:hypothetical protein
MQDLRAILESIEKVDASNQRTAERIELAVPAEIRTGRGNTISAMTREISRYGIGLLHRGSLSLGEVTVRMASETREYSYRVSMEWCTPCGNGMFISGGRFLTDPTDGGSAATETNEVDHTAGDQSQPDLSDDDLFGTDPTGVDPTNN